MTGDYLDDMWEEEDEESSESIWEGAFLGDLKELASHYIQVFFRNEESATGYVFDKEILLLEKHINLVLNTDISNGVDQIYDWMAKNGFSSLKSTEQIKMVLALLKRCAKLGIPQCFAGGISKMYFELGCHERQTGK